MHPVDGGEDVVEVGPNVVGGERDELASTPIHSAEEVVGVVVVDEGDEQADDEVVVAVVLPLDLEHGRSAGREVAVAGAKEEAGQLLGPPPPGDGPDPETVLHDPAIRPLPLRGGGRAAPSGAVVLHLR